MKKLLKKLKFSIIGVVITISFSSFLNYANAQTLYVPTGVSGIATTTNGNNNVGIGTGNNPSAILHIATSSLNDGIYLTYKNGNWTRLTPPNLGQGSFNSVVQNNDAALIFGGPTIDAVNSGFAIAPWRSGYLGAGLRMDQNGNVGIGTSLVNNPNGYKLAVNGTIGAKAIIVENTSSTWADYVFEKDYNLLSLSEVEKYIKANKHLPEVPTTVQVEKNGIDVAGMDVILLKKIEELTLHMIEMKKEIEVLKKK